MKKRISSVQIIALGFLSLIIIGSLLLMLPAATYEGISYMEALFTAVSATCVTGLVVVDTATTYTAFGQAVLLLLIQTGGLGFMTIGFLFLRLLRKEVGLQEKEVITESLNSSTLSGVPQLVGFILKGTGLIELSGAILLSTRYIPLLGLKKGIWYSVFHSISAFCNAGFDLMGSISGKYSSMTLFARDPIVVITLCLLITIGGLGFCVWSELLEHRKKRKHFSLTTKVVLTASLLLTAGGCLLFLLTERGSADNGFLPALFNAVTPRTAGFNTVDTASLSGGGRLLTIIFMLIGGSPGSTAGGIKTTTIAVMLFFASSKMKKTRGVHVYGRQINIDALEKAITVLFYNLLLAVAGAVLILILQPLSMSDVLFETFSAMGTVGMSTGITRALIPASRVIIMILMYLGRVGSTSFASALLERKARPAVEYPTEDITIG